MLHLDAGLYLLVRAVLRYCRDGNEGSDDIERVSPMDLENSAKFCQVTPCETHDKLQHHLHFFRASLINAVFSYMPSPIKKSIVGFYRWQTDYEVYQALLFFQQT